MGAAEGDAEGDAGATAEGGAAPPPDPLARRACHQRAGVLYSRPSLPGGGVKGRFWQPLLEVEDDEAVSERSADESSPPPSTRRAATLGEFLDAANELGGSLRSSSRRTAFAPGGRGSRFRRDPRPGCPAAAPERRSRPRAGALRPESATPRQAPADGAAPSGDDLGAWPPLGQGTLAETPSLPLWAVPELYLGRRPVEPMAAQPARVPLLDLAPASRPALGLEAQVGRGPPTQPTRWWWVPKGLTSLELGFPASRTDVRRHRNTARSIALAQPPPPLLLSFAAAVMSGRGAAPAGQGHGHGGRNGNGKRPAVEDARAEANARSNLPNKDRPRRQGSSSGGGGGQQQHQQPQWWLDREKKREARRAAAAAQQPENLEVDRGRGRGSARAAGKPPAPPAKKQQGAAGPPVPAGGGAGGSGLAQVECFKCGRPGHFQASCTAEPICVICGKEGHHSAACPSKGKEPELSMMGHAISGEGFFYVDFEEDDDEEDDLSNSAIITFPGVALTAAGLEQELRHLVEGEWDWQVRALGEREFAVVFPSKDTLTFSARSGKLFLTLCGTVVDIKLADADPAPAEKLQEVWVRISGLPRCMRRTRRLMVGMRMLGRPLEVDHSTLKARGPVRMRVACRNPSKLNGAVQFFHNSLDYNVGIRVEEPRGATSAPRQPSPPHQDDDMDDDDDDANTPSEDEWRALGDKDRAKAAERSKSLPATTQSREPAAEATDEPAEPVAVITARGASEPPALRGQVELRIDQYGSNLSKAAPWPVPLVVLEQTRAAEEARREQAPTPPPAAVRMDPPVSPPVDSSTLLTTGSDYDSEDSLGSPATHKDTDRVAEAEEEGGVVDDTEDFARRPVLSEATVPRARRTRTVPVGPARKSARLQGPASAIPIMQRAQEFTAARNLDPTEAQAALAFAAARRAHNEAGEASLLGEAPAESVETAQAEAVEVSGEASADPSHDMDTAPHANARGRSKTRGGARYTWTNKQLNPVRSVLDRVLVSTDWEMLFPLCSLTGLTIIGSDHAPLILDSGEDARRRAPRFYFEKGWLQRADFGELVTTKWHSLEGLGGPFFDPIDAWQHVSGGLRQFLKGWGANIGKADRDLKEDILGRIQALDTRADTTGLDDEGWALRYHLEGQLTHLLKMEQEYWRQRGRQSWLLHGDANTAYFHAIANGRRRKCTIARLVTDQGIITESRDLQEHIYSFYRNLMGAEGENRLFSLTQDTWVADRRVSDAENEDLMLSFSGEEVDGVLKSMKVDTAPGPDGFPVIFFKRFWALVKPYILAILNGFALGRVDIARLNFGVLTLIPKIRQFRPIALINEIIHETKSKRLRGVFLKLDFEKAYDRVNWSFLREVLLRKGFNPGWVHRVLSLVSGGQTAITINGEVGNYFRNGRGVRQGDPLSPLLFDFVAEALAAILDRALAAGHIEGVIPHIIPGGVSHLQYADDTIIMIQPEDLAIANLKFLLLCFENMSGLRINFHKSEVMVMGTSDLEKQRIANMLNCKQGSFPFTYLGLPISDHAITAADWGPLTAKVAKRADPWTGKFMSSAARLILVNACLSSLPLHAMGVYMLGDGIHDVLRKHRAKFFWEANGPKKKYHWVRWDAVCMPKSMGGLGIMDTKLMNVCLMAKWVWKIMTGAQGLWADIIRGKYLNGRDIWVDSHPRGSQFWNTLQKIKRVLCLGTKHQVVSGTSTRFWHDWWLGPRPFRERFPGLFAISADPEASVAQAAAGGFWDIPLRRELGRLEHRELNDIRRDLQTVGLRAGRDVIRWSLEPSGEFSSTDRSSTAAGPSARAYQDLPPASAYRKEKTDKEEEGSYPQGGRRVPPDHLDRPHGLDPDEIRGSPTPLAPRRRQKPRLIANGAWRNLFGRDTTAMASAASPTKPYHAPAKRTDPRFPSLPPPERPTEKEGTGGATDGTQGIPRSPPGSPRAIPFSGAKTRPISACREPGCVCNAGAGCTELTTGGDAMKWRCQEASDVAPGGLRLPVFDLLVGFSGCMRMDEECAARVGTDPASHGQKAGGRGRRSVARFGRPGRSVTVEVRRVGGADDVPGRMAANGWKRRPPMGRKS
ncbi:hypothetical protein QYE76_020402 [Lolium multiflorum]|uniref:Retrotransposon protein, putative, unclassified n=1 Tax=Lolium multiflorum TaxID=4521 RepID=A0AAD8VRU8_LOLMU|nr:hypothetical protein QYE76_020402 [Lolium multiflorum]